MHVSSEETRSGEAGACAWEAGACMAGGEGWRVHVHGREAFQYRHLVERQHVGTQLGEPLLGRHVPVGVPAVARGARGMSTQWDGHKHPEGGASQSYSKGALGVEVALRRVRAQPGAVVAHLPGGEWGISTHWRGYKHPDGQRRRRTGVTSSEKRSVSPFPPGVSVWPPAAARTTATPSPPPLPPLPPPLPPPLRPPGSSTTETVPPLGPFQLGGAWPSMPKGTSHSGSSPLRLSCGRGGGGDGRRIWEENMGGENRGAMGVAVGGAMGGEMRGDGRGEPEGERRDPEGEARGEG